MSEKVSGAVDATTGNPPDKGAEQEKETKQISMSDRLIAAAREEGIPIGLEPTQPAAAVGDTKTEETSTGDTKSETGDAIEETPSTEETSATEETATEETGTEDQPPKGLSLVDQQKWYEEHGLEVPWYIPRLIETSSKSRERGDRIEKLEGEVGTLRSQLSQATAPKPSPDNPFADIYDEAGLRKMETVYEDLLQFAEKNRNGAENVVLGKDEHGNDIRGDVSAEEISDIRYKADRALRRDIPQRRGYLVERSKADAMAVEVYPELKDQESKIYKEAVATLRALPQLETIVGPEVLIWIAHALKGREAYLARNGKEKAGADTTDAARRITESARTRIAPTPTKPRSTIERKSGENLEAADKRLEKEGTPEAAAAWLASRRQSSGGTRKVEQVAK